jgi:hypothetical protein
LYFIATDGARGLTLRRTIDVRPPIPVGGDPVTRGLRWAFDVTRVGEDNRSPEMVLQFAGMDRIPTGIELRLLDRVLERVIDLRHQGEYRYAGVRVDFVAQDSSARFELLAGTQAFVEAQSTFVAQPRVTRLLPIIPNPAANFAIIRFETARAGRVTVSVFDFAGRRVRTLCDTHRDVGLHEFVWRGDDDLGRLIPPGVYFVRLATPDHTDTRKLVRVR